MSVRRPKPTLIDKLEFALATLMGQASWPFAVATLESQLTLNSLTAQARSSGVSFFCFTFEVDGTIYTSAIRRFWWKHNYMMKLPRPDRIQYDPRDPTRTYYAPAHTLVNNTVAVLSALALVVVILEVAR